jgi:hypothetical protein
LSNRGIDVATSQEAGLLGTSDLEQLAYANREGRVIFTEDAHFLVIAAQTSEHAGITYARKQTRSMLTAVLTLGATPAQMGLLVIADSLPKLLFSLFAGVWVDLPGGNRFWSAQTWAAPYCWHRSRWPRCSAL